MNKLRTLKRLARQQVSNRIWNYLMKDGQRRRGRQPFGAEELRLLRDALVSQNLCCIDGRMVPAFERAFAEAHDVPYAVASTSGTAAIHVALGAIDLEPGDEVITAPITDLGTIIPIISQGGIPVFADIDGTFNMDPADVERRITPRTRAIIAVHLFGNPCDMGQLRAIADRHHCVLIEDCSQAHLARYDGRLVGTIGDIGCFSFQQSKHMTTGDGGMTITANPQYYERMKLFADKGFARKGFGARAYLFHAPNYRMTELVGAVGLAQLGKLPDVIARRRELGALMTQELANVPGIECAPVTPGATHSYWLYPLLTTAADGSRIVDAVRAAGLYAGLGYTGKPIYLCSESLTAKKTYGRSQWPFTAAPPGVVHEYREGLCPRAEDTLPRLVCISLDESWSRRDVTRAAAAIRAAATGVATTTVSSATAARTHAPVHVVAEQKVRIGIVGCGQMGRWHLDAYQRNPRVEVVAFADAHLAHADAFAREAGGRAYESHIAMLAGERLDGISICTVPVTHRAIAADALRAGVHVLCEKPLATSREDAEAMAALAEAQKRLLLTAFKFRFFDEVIKTRELIASGAIGNIIHARLMFGGYMDMSGSWYAQPEMSGGGVLLDNGPHAFDLARALFGEIASVSATTSRHQQLSVEDTAQVRCELARGGVLTVDLSWSLPVPSRNYLEIFGSQGAALLDLEGLSYRLNTWRNWKRVANQASIKDAFARQTEHFVAAIGSGRPHVTTLADGVATQRLIEAAYRSVATSRPVALIEERFDVGGAIDRTPEMAVEQV
jgi:perosamine synthetase